MTKTQDVGAYDVGAPTLQVTVYQAGCLVTSIPCETPEEAAEIVAEWETLDEGTCVVEDLAVRHGDDDVLAPEPEDGLEPDDGRDR